jgi:hypothetical protein
MGRAIILSNSDVIIFNIMTVSRQKGMLQMYLKSVEQLKSSEATKRLLRASGDVRCTKIGIQDIR